MFKSANFIGLLKAAAKQRPATNAKSPVDDYMARITAESNARINSKEGDPAAADPNDSPGVAAAKARVRERRKRVYGTEGPITGDVVAGTIRRKVKEKKAQGQQNQQPQAQGQQNQPYVQQGQQRQQPIQQGQQRQQPIQQGQQRQQPIQRPQNNQPQARGQQRQQPAQQGQPAPVGNDLNARVDAIFEAGRQATMARTRALAEQMWPDSTHTGYAALDAANAQAQGRQNQPPANQARVARYGDAWQNRLPASADAGYAESDAANRGVKVRNVLPTPAQPAAGSVTPPNVAARQPSAQPVAAPQVTAPTTAPTTGSTPAQAPTATGYGRRMSMDEWKDAERARLKGKYDPDKIETALTNEAYRKSNGGRSYVDMSRYRPKTVQQ